MLIKQIMDGDTPNCHNAFMEDEQLKYLEEELYTALSKCLEDTFFEIERAVNVYAARAIRIAYLQGIKDFAELHITLKEDIHTILQKCE